MTRHHQKNFDALRTVILTASAFSLCLCWSAGAQTAASPFDTAVAVWHMSDTKDAVGADSELVAKGNVALSKELTGAEREASLQRGGDGKAARFDGGYLSAGQGANDELKLAGNAMSMCLRVRLDEGVVDTPLFSKHGGHNVLAYNLFCTDLGAGSSFGFELGLDANEKPLQLSVPLSGVGATNWHDIIARFSGAKLEMFVDGVLVDEDWPMGALRQGNSEPCLIGAQSYNGEVKSVFRGWIDHAALWNRALTDEEVTYLSGGSTVVAKRDLDILGSARASMQYWRPRGFNANVGDCMPFFHDGRFHVFYLFDRRHHASKWGLGAHQWAHVSSTDLVHWEQHPMAIPITQPWEGSICTGSVFFHDGVYYAHYAVRMPDFKEHLAVATSTDGVHFEKSPTFPLASPQEGYDPMQYRDPFVFEDTKAGLFRMLVTARLTDGRDGCLAQLTSKDLKTWTLADPFIIPGRVTDCPDYFEWNSRHYLFAEFVYWISQDTLGPWTSPQPDKLDTLYVPKTAPFTGGRRIYVSWLPDNGWGGDMIFRELVQHEDGTLSTKFLPEVMPANGEPVAWTATGGSSNRTTVVLDKSQSLQTATVSSIPRDFRMTCRVTPEAGASRFGVAVRGTEGYKQACELRFEPGKQNVQFGSAANGQAAEKPSCSIDFVKGLDRAFTIDLIVKGNIVDACIGGQRTIITRCGETGDNVFLFAQDGKVTFDQVEIRPLVEDAR